MKPNLLYFLFIFFFNIFHATTAHNLIHETCKKCAQNDSNVDYEFCATALQSIPRSYNASLHQLGIISINLNRSNVTHTRSYIKKLLKRKMKKNKNLDYDPYIRACLVDCFDLYSDAVSTLKQAIKDYKSSRYEDANFQVSSVMDASTACEDGFKEKHGVVSPLTKKNNDEFQLSAISLSIINMVR
ncbi:hypothetical protein LWI28_016530 [Acer negundo]|uniref:Pectinesterase inhibitor domain-containing protein n=1 Tax=Acer negundo TaxID=4023 RepID=A0AAD5NTB5_ACENE|nr:hypothetical protein LWI28_016530 [Acer negundo]KAK4847296.1 hypothetical protein QYF36_000470 [Acer negundo]KAK4847758.1 hypothetical protein QYF36_005520 [Acer negundo]